MLQLLAQVDNFDYSATTEMDPNAAAGIAAAFGGFFLIMMIVLVVLGVFTIWMFIDAIIRNDNEYPNGNGKIMWILLIIFVGFIPAVIYFFVVKKKIPRGSKGGQLPPANATPPTDNVPPPAK